MILIRFTGFKYLFPSPATALCRIIPRRFRPAVVGLRGCALGRAFPRCKAHALAKGPGRRKAGYERSPSHSLRHWPARWQDAQTARTIIQQNIEAINASVRRQSALNHAAVRQRINVAAGEQQHNFATGEFGQLTAQQRGQSRRACAFDDALFQFRQSQHRQRERFFLNLHHAMNQWPRDGQRVPTRLGYGQSICERKFCGNTNWSFRCQACGEARGVRRFNADDLQIRLERMKNSCDAGQQSAAADRNQNGFGKKLRGLFLLRKFAAIFILCPCAMFPSNLGIAVTK